MINFTNTKDNNNKKEYFDFGNVKFVTTKKEQLECVEEIENIKKHFMKNSEKINISFSYNEINSRTSTSNQSKKPFKNTNFNFQILLIFILNAFLFINNCHKFVKNFIEFINFNHIK